MKRQSGMLSRTLPQAGVDGGMVSDDEVGQAVERFRFWRVALGVGLLLGSLGALHWVYSPYALGLWIRADTNGEIELDVRCQDGEARTPQRQAIAPGYYYYRLPLPRCVLSDLGVRASKWSTADLVVASAAITAFGSNVKVLFGDERGRVGESAFRVDSRPRLSQARSLSGPLAMPARGTDVSGSPVTWPRWCVLLAFPVGLLAAAIVQTPGAAPRLRTGSPLFVPSLLAATCAFVCATAITVRTDVSVNPDELSHVESARFYFDHWLKPAFGDPATWRAHLSNRYGVAYLLNPQPVYFLAGKFAVLTWPLFGNEVVALRMFNVLLLGLLAVLAWRVPGVGAASVPLLATPQAWYVFSYFNGDAVPLFVLTVLVAQLLCRRDQFLVNPDRGRPPTLAAVLLGIGVGVVILSKANYWPVLAFVGLCLLAKWNLASTTAVWLLAAALTGGLVSVLLAADAASSPAAYACGLLAVLAGVGAIAVLLRVFRQVRRRLRDGRHIVRPVVAAAVATAGIVLPTIAYDTLLNGLPFSSARAERRQALLELAAEPGWKPSDAFRGDHANLRLRAQGVSLGHVLLNRRWIQRTVSTFVGVYGYVNIYPPRALIRTAALAFGCFALVAVLVARRDATDSLASAIVPALLAGVVAVAVSAVGFSWLYDFQPQGRYLLPVLPMLGGALVAAGPAGWSSRSLWLAVVAAYTLAVLSFVMVALPSLPKRPSAYGVASQGEPQ